MFSLFSYNHGIPTGLSRKMRVETQNLASVPLQNLVSLRVFLWQRWIAILENMWFANFISAICCWLQSLIINNEDALVIVLLIFHHTQ